MASESSSASRIDYVDGLRGVAIGLVVLHHSYMDLLHSGHHLPNMAFFSALAWVAGRGYLGVPLFFVLSGFCLSYPALQRRAAGKESWFSASQFFARRCLRILPPYYAALFLCIALNLGVTLVHLHVKRSWSLTQPIDLPNFLTHVLLVHNLTPYHDAINGPFWSLGLEWQWYWVFPLLLFFFIRFPRLAVALCVGMVVSWHFLVVGWPHSFAYLEGLALPGVLLMFCFGIIVAQLTVSRGTLPVWLLLLGTVVPILLAEVPTTQRVVGDIGLYESSYGLAFACLALLGAHSTRARGILSWSPLVYLGLISYSVYLAHQPVMAAFAYFGQKVLHGSPVTMVIASAMGIAAGLIFHLIVERPCMRRETWDAVGPALTRFFGWTDSAFARPATARRRQTEVPRLEAAEHIP